MITMHARPSRTDRQTDGYHGNSATIRSNERALKFLLCPVNIQKCVQCVYFIL